MLLVNFYLHVAIVLYVDKLSFSQHQVLDAALNPCQLEFDSIYKQML